MKQKPVDESYFLFGMISVVSGEVYQKVKKQVNLFSVLQFLNPSLDV